MAGYLLSPPVAFVIYVALVALLAGAGRALAGRPIATPLKSSTYSSGEAPPTRPAAPGYRPFFVMALFFAVLHLGVLMLGSGAPTIVAAVYLGGLMLALIALIAG